jgi:hypothetical protein
MNRLPFILSAITLAVLAGCATESGITSAPAPVVKAPVVAAPAQPAYVVAPAGTVVVPQAAAGTMVLAPTAVALRAGFGRVESITAVPVAAGGETAKPSSRVVMRMEDGSTQYFDTQATGMAIGDRIEITANGTMRHPA